MKRMLINATQPEELRVALVDGQSLYDFDIEQIGQERKRSNIYKGRVSRIEKSLGAAFVEFGSERHGFLPIKELAPEFLKNKSTKSTIDESLTQGQEIIVQVEKEERGTKGAVLSTFISLPGHYLVLMPNNPDSGGISRSIEGDARQKMKTKLNSLEVPQDMGLILRTAGEGISLEDLNWDLKYLLNLWDAIQEAFQLRKAPYLIFKENDLISRSLRDFLKDDITEVLIDTDEAYEKAYDFSSTLMPDFEDRIKKYDESIPLFTRYQIESQIETAYQREVSLPNGGAIVIDQTEALVSIDINSAKATGGSDIEETALKTNLEAAKEIAKQLRVRDMGGLIVIDFIDMQPLKNKRKVEDVLWTALSIDRAKVQVGRISRFGLLEMSRQRLRPSLQERWTQDIGSLSTAVLRLIEEEASKKKSGEVRAVVSSDMSVFLLNERRARINEIEEKTSVRIIVVSDPARSDNRFEVSRIKDDQKKSKEPTSYQIQEAIEHTKNSKSRPQDKKIEKAVVNLLPSKKPKKKKEGFFSKLINSLSTGTEDSAGIRKTKLESINKTKINKNKQFKKQKKVSGIKPTSKNTKTINKKNSTQEKAKKNDNKQKSARPSAQRKVRSLDREDIKSDPKGKVTARSSDQRKVRSLDREDIKSDSKEKVIPTDKVSFEKKGVHPKKNSILNDEKNNEPDKKAIKSAKEWGQATNDPRKKTT